MGLKKKDRKEKPSRLAKDKKRRLEGGWTVNTLRFPGIKCKNAAKLAFFLSFKGE